MIKFLKPSVNDKIKLRVVSVLLLLMGINAIGASVSAFTSVQLVLKLSGGDGDNDDYTVENYGSLAGIVCDSDYYRLANVTVTILDSDNNKPLLTNITDINGSYSFSKVPVGIHRVKYYRAGYRPVIATVLVVPRTTPNAILINWLEPIVLEGPEIEILEATKLTNATLKGRVYNHSSFSSTDALLSNVTLTLMPINMTTVTDVNGSYIFEQVQPGRYILSAELEGYRPTKIELLLLPDTVHELNITLFPAMTQQNLTIEYKLEAKVDIFGRILESSSSATSTSTTTATTTDSDSKPVVNALVTIFSPNYRLTTYSDENGKFEFRAVPVDIYQLEISAECYEMLYYKYIIAYSDNNSNNNSRVSITVELVLDKCYEFATINLVNMEPFYTCGVIEFILAVWIFIATCYAWLRRRRWLVLTGILCGFISFAGPPIIIIPTIFTLTLNEFLALIAFIIVIKSWKSFK